MVKETKFPSLLMMLPSSEIFQDNFLEIEKKNSKKKMETSNNEVWAVRKKKKPTAPEGVPRRSPTPVLTGPFAA
jgi:hypothetical protein